MPYSTINLVIIHRTCFYDNSKITITNNNGTNNKAGRNIDITYICRARYCQRGIYSVSLRKSIMNVWHEETIHTQTHWYTQTRTIYILRNLHWRPAVEVYVEYTHTHTHLRTPTHTYTPYTHRYIMCCIEYYY